MAMELDSLIQKIKEEGVQEAKRRSEDIVSRAERDARAIIEDAQKTKEAIVQKGQREAANLKKNGEEALRQASRDVLLSLRQKITELFDRIIKSKVSEQLSPESLKKIIIKVIENFRKEEGLGIEILLSEQDKKALEDVFLKALKDELRKGVTLKVSAGIERGFRVGEKGKNFYYDFTDEAIAEVFKVYLNPKIAEILDVSGKSGK